MIFRLWSIAMTSRESGLARIKCHYLDSSGSLPVLHLDSRNESFKEAPPNRSFCSLQLLSAVTLYLHNLKNKLGKKTRAAKTVMQIFTCLGSPRNWAWPK